MVPPNKPLGHLAWANNTGDWFSMPTPPQLFSPPLGSQFLEPISSVILTTEVCGQTFFWVSTPSLSQGADSTELPLPPACSDQSFDAIKHPLSTWEFLFPSFFSLIISPHHFWRFIFSKPHSSQTNEKQLKRIIKNVSTTKSKMADMKKNTTFR